MTNLFRSRFRASLLAFVVGFIVISAAVGFRLYSGEKLPCSEVDPRDTGVIANVLSETKAVVIGEFRVRRCLPWFDGWHCKGSLVVSEKLLGESIKSDDILPFLWTEEFRGYLFDQLRVFDGDRGVWFLRIENGKWSLSSSPGIWCGPMPIEVRNDVIEQIRRKKLGRVEQE